MLDTSIIKAKYTRMTDYELVQLVQTEGYELTKPALALLHEEFVNRNLDMTAFEDMETARLEKKRMFVDRAKEGGEEAFTKAVWNFALDEKYAGKTDDEVQRGIMEMGLDEEQALHIVQSIESKAKETLGNLNTDMLISGLVFMIGLFISVTSYASAMNGGRTYFITWSAIVFGAFRCMRALSKKEKYKTILAVIEAERLAKEEDNSFDASNQPGS